MKTHLPKVGDINKQWYLVDAKDEVLGRLATRIATVLRGKHKPTYTPFMDTGDFVVVVNAEKVKVTGKKLDDKTYYRHSQHPGGLKQIVLKDLLAKRPEDVIKKAVWGMLPKGVLGRKMFRKLKVYTGDAHPHQAQQPQPLT
ncbi:MAG: 50S ribosomal protein L13 [Thermodesulfobacteriota bacterium]